MSERFPEAERMTDEEKRQLAMFRALPQQLQEWWRKKVFLAFTMAGQEPDYVKAWFNLSIESRWKLIGYLTAESVSPQSLKVPIIKASDIKVQPLKSANTISATHSEIPRTDNATEKVKKILLIASKIRFIGAEGCGKTSKARWLCRERIALGHKVYWINPHLNADDNQKLKAAGVTIVGGGRDYQAIADFCLAMVDGDSCELSKNYEKYASVVGAKFTPVTFVLDELTNYKDEVGEPIEKFIKASMQEFSKISWHTIYITHNDTLACMGAPNGTANLIKASVFDLRLETDILRGNRVPKAIAQYRMPNTDNWQPVTIPVEWQ